VFTRTSNGTEPRAPGAGGPFVDPDPALRVIALSAFRVEAGNTRAAPNAADDDVHWPLQRRQLQRRQLQRVSAGDPVSTPSPGRAPPRFSGSSGLGLLASGQVGSVIRGIQADLAPGEQRDETTPIRDRREALDRSDGARDLHRSVLSGYTSRSQRQWPPAKRCPHWRA
jgi:hypothetical protein